ncbi:MAG TPA: hypothetical protein VNU92_08795 [Edaphobacter sp.]|jgi:hypothetical protein|nr:hypothetical protein [Edaphobacter sp.]
MPVPKYPIPNLYFLFRKVWAALFLLAIPLFGKGPEPPLRIPLQNFGFQPISNEFLLNGSSMFTIHYVDDKHLLLTFVVHRLIPRLPDEPKDDLDRLVDGLLVELPSGKILARTSWHLHDHAQYLWNLGHGHFLLRVRDTLTTIAPLANLGKAEPFDQHPFLESPDRHLAALIPSPEGDLLIIESVKRKPPHSGIRASVVGPPVPSGQSEKNPVQIDFLRLNVTDDGGPIQGSFAGAVQSDNTGDVPVTTAGYLAIVDQGRPHWAFDFHSFAGKVHELSPFDSTCSPVPIFVSRSEFIAFGCRGGRTMQQIGGFNMRGEEMWEQGLFGDFVAPSLAFSPASGRFALSRILLRTSAVSDQPISVDEVSGQSVVVYQTGTGKQLLRADCSPAERAGQNFALSPNGETLAVIHADALEIYTLPPLTNKDQNDIKLAQSTAPAENDLPIRFSGQEPVTDVVHDSHPAAEPQAQPATAPVPAQATNTPTDTDSSATKAADPVVSAPATAAQPSTASPPEQRRQPPTLYTLPDDKPPSQKPQ